MGLRGCLGMSTLPGELRFGGSGVADWTTAMLDQLLQLGGLSQTDWRACTVAIAGSGETENVVFDPEAPCLIDTPLMTNSTVAPRCVLLTSTLGWPSQSENSTGASGLSGNTLTGNDECL